MSSSWIAYNDLAWTEDWLADPADCEKEAQYYVNLLLQAAEKKPHTLLHLGCGAGTFDHVLKRYFTVTGVDLSRGMLDKARVEHSDIEYLEDDMRTVRLNRQFDAVIIPDGIDYMVSEVDLRKTIQTAALHLKTGGVLLVVAKPAETFQDNNFVYSGEKDGVLVTLFENNYINPFCPNTYEATLVYLIRRAGKLSVFTDQQVLGLFPGAVWDEVFTDSGFNMRKTTLNGVYDKYLLEEGAYPLTVFLGQRTG